jgi:hypothetical protein
MGGGGAGGSTFLYGKKSNNSKNRRFCNKLKFSKSTRRLLNQFGNLHNRLNNYLHSHNFG